MTPKIIKGILIFSIFLSLEPLMSAHQKQNKHQKKNKYGGKKSHNGNSQNQQQHSGGGTPAYYAGAMSQSGIPGMPVSATNTINPATKMPMVQAIPGAPANAVTNTINPATGMPITQTQTIPGTQISATPAPYAYQMATNNEMLVTSSQMTGNGMSMTVTQQLDPMKGAQLISDLATLKQNYQILSNMLEYAVKSFIKNASFETGSNQQTVTSLNYNRTLPAFDPTKQIFNPNGHYANSNAGSSVSTTNPINPYTGNPITLFDLPILKELRKLYLSNVFTLLFALGDMDCCLWNIKQMQKYMPLQFRTLTAPLGQSRAYDFNLVGPLWQQSSNFIKQGKLKINQYQRN